MTRGCDDAGAILYAKLIGKLMEGNVSYGELAEYTGLSYTTCVRYINALRSLPHGLPHKKVVHISGWDKDTQGRHSIRLYSFGAAADVKAPKQTAAQSKAKYRAKKARVNSVFQLGGPSP